MSFWPSTRSKYSFSIRMSIHFFISVIFGLNRVWSCETTSVIRFACCSRFLIFIIRTTAAYPINIVLIDLNLNSKFSIFFHSFVCCIAFFLDLLRNWNVDVHFSTFAKISGPCVQKSYLLNSLFNENLCALSISVFSSSGSMFNTFAFTRDYKSIKKTNSILAMLFA